MEITIDNNAGFCWGVVRTVDMVEEWLEKMKNEKVYILGQIIHNPKETERLAQKGLITVSHDDLKNLPKKSKVIFRAHGEPPETYEFAEKLGLEIIDATCPLVKALQKRVRKYYDKGYQIIIFGKREHAEVVGLRGFCNDECIVIRSVDEALEKVDLEQKSVLLSQTTMHRPTFCEVKEALEKKALNLIDGDVIENLLDSRNTICKYVADREEILKKFASENDLVVFVAGRNSSNGKSLYQMCKSANENTHFIEEAEEIDYTWFNGATKVGITGATSTPQWYMSHVKNIIEKNYQN